MSCVGGSLVAWEMGVFELRWDGLRWEGAYARYRSWRPIGVDEVDWLVHSDFHGVLRGSMDLKYFTVLGELCYYNFQISCNELRMYDYNI
jgi:hypothetical protein